MRRLRFFVLEQLILPLAMLPFRLLVWSWRLTPPDPAVVEACAREPRLVLATFHGMFLQLVSFAPIAAAHGRRLVVMLSPSLDGRLLAAFLRYFGIDHVSATTASRGVAGSRELVRRIEAGGIGVVAVDGPRGPCCVAKPGVRRLAAAAGARVATIVTAADRGVTFGSWDRAQLPLLFARVRLELALTENDARDANPLGADLLAAANRLNSAVVPPRLRDS